MVPPVQLLQPVSPDLAGALEMRETSEPGGASELGETPEPGGLDDFDGPPTPLPLVERRISHLRRVTPPVGSVRYGGEGKWGSVGGENRPAPDITTALSGVHVPSAISEPSADSDLSTEGSETSSSNRIRPVFAMTRTAPRQLEPYLLGSRVSEELGRFTAQTRALNQETAGLKSMFGPNYGGK